MRGFNYKKSVQGLNFFAVANGGTINKMKAIKLIWLSDRLHLRKFARTITGDEYYALPNGPVPSATRDILEENNFVPDAASEYSTGYIHQIDKFHFKSIKATNVNVFSKTDLECLKMALDNFGHLSQFGLSELSHTFPEWTKHESALENKLSSRFLINQLDFFVNIYENSKLFQDPLENISLVKEIYQDNKQVALLIE